jgi:hypothetical protein
MNNEANPSDKDLAALYRLHTDMTGVQGLEIPEGKRWLNTFEEVDSIVRLFTSEYLRHLGTLSDTYTWEDLGRYVDTQAGNLNDLFLGYPAEDPVYERGVWNTPAQLGHSMRIQTQISGEDRLAVRDAFVQHSLAVTDIVQSHKDDPVEVWGWKIDALIEDLASAIMGIDNRLPEETDSE